MQIKLDPAMSLTGPAPCMSDLLGFRAAANERQLPLQSRIEHVRGHYILLPRGSRMLSMKQVSLSPQAALLLLRFFSELFSAASLRAGSCI